MTRNIKRFPEDFLFRLKKDEYEILKFQIGISSWGGKMRQILESHKEIIRQIESLQINDLEQDRNIMLIFECLKQLNQVKEEEADFKNRKRIGFQRQSET
ncbi:MAG: ORF6N domain-containing protein [Bacteroidota bacterium]